MARRKATHEGPGVVAMGPEAAPQIQRLIPGAAQAFTIPIKVDALALKAELGDVAQALAVAQSWKITSPGMLEATSELNKEILRKYDAVESMRLSAVGPANQLLKVVNGWFEDRHVLKKISNLLKKAIADYELEDQRIYQANMREAARAHAAGDVQAATQAMVVAQATVTGPPAGNSIRRFWRATVINPGLVPYEYLCPDVAKIGQHAAATPTDREPSPIPGVKFELDATVTTRR